MVVLFGHFPGNWRLWPAVGGTVCGQYPVLCTVPQPEKDPRSGFIGGKRAVGIPARDGIPFGYRVVVLFNSTRV
jgi:hypothetical protein